MLETGDLGGKCADIKSLFVGLARAAGLPARDVFGVRLADSAVSKSLGKSRDVTKAQHCRAEVFIDGKGWFPVDPADVRKVILEEQVAIDSDKVKALRERLFGHWEMNWVGFNYGRDFTMPGLEQGPIGFLMYPYAEGPKGGPRFTRPRRLRLHDSVVGKRLIGNSPSASRRQSSPGFPRRGRARPARAGPC